MGKLMLKKVKVHEDMSEETICFSADLYDDGKLVAHVKNDGRGGCNDVYPAKGVTYEEVQKYYNIDTECEIMTLAEESNVVKKHQSKGFVLKKDEKIYTTKNKFSFAKMKTMRGYDSWLKSQVEKFEKDGYEILNTNINI